MAKTQNNTDAAPLADLRKEAVDHLDSIGGELEEAEKDLDALEKIGVDVSRLRERIAWGKNARDIILKRFGERG